MAYTDDWENLMNGVFGAGGRPRFGGTAQPEAKPQKSGTSAVPDLNAALLENQKQLDALLKKQNAQLRTKDDAVQSALKDSRQMLRDMEADGLLAKGTADTKPEQLGSFEGLAAEVKKTVLGQDAFVDSVVRAMRRPFVLGTEGDGLADGTIACSATNLWTCLQNVLKWNVPEEEAIRAATFNPAKAIGAADKVGTIETGKLADFVVTNADYTQKRVFIGGKEI